MPSKNSPRYTPRILDAQLSAKLAASGAVLIKGPKFCGKTETAKQFAKSILEMDRNPQVPIIMATQPGLLLAGETPRLIDEWQIEPEIWNYVRHEVDDRKRKGQFILTGSSNPQTEGNLHSGSGRFTVIPMDTMTWQELGYSNGTVKLGNLLHGRMVESTPTTVALDQIIERMLVGGWPALLGETPSNAMMLNRGYVDLLCETNLTWGTGIRRDPLKIKNLLRSLARNTATMVSNKALEQDVMTTERNEISRNTVSEYLDALIRLMVVFEQPAFNTHLRSAASLRKSSKKHFCDPSLAAAVLGLDHEALVQDLRYTGFLFETLAVHELKVYGQANDAEVYHYHDSYGMEVDAIVQHRNGNYAAFEIKLGVGHIEEAAKNLKKFEANVDTSKMRLPKSLNILTGTGMSYRRSDGVQVVSLAALGV